MELITLIQSAESVAVVAAGLAMLTGALTSSFAFRSKNKDTALREIEEQGVFF